MGAKEGEFRHSLIDFFRIGASTMRYVQRWPKYLLLKYTGIVFCEVLAL